MRALALATLLCLAAPAAAATAVAVSVEELARGSAAVVRGKVTGARAHRSEDGRRIFTTYDVKVARVWRGVAPRKVKVTVPGGTLGDLAQRVDAAPELAKGEEVVLFLERAGPGRFAIAGMAQGKFAVEAGRARPGLDHFVFVRTAVPEGERRAEEMPLEELERRVRSAR